MRFFILLSFLLFTSCQFLGSFQGLTSYRHQIEDQNDIDVQEFSCHQEIFNKPTVEIVNGKQLKQCLASSINTAVYLWKPNCTSKVCIDIALADKMFYEKNITLFIVAEYYDFKKMSAVTNLTSKLCGIDTYYYKTDFTSRYLKLFFKDVLHSDEKVTDYKFFIFENGTLKGKYKYLDDVVL